MPVYTYTTIDDPLGTFTDAFGINDMGQIVGEYFDPSATTVEEAVDPALPDDTAARLSRSEIGSI